MFLYVTVVFSVWPAPTVVWSSASAVEMIIPPGDGGGRDAAVTVKSTVLEVPPPGAGLETLILWIAAVDNELGVILSSVPSTKVADIGLPS